MNLHVASQDSFEKLAQNMGEMIDNLFQKKYVGFRPSKAWEPHINIYEDAESLLVCVELAGMRREEIDVQIMPGRLTIRGARPDPKLPGHDGPFRVHLLEIHHGPFARAISLPSGVDLDAVSAQYRKGYLWIRLPKKND
ncbi:MAG: Hsp20/alpha crystallin family protein [Phycisphaerae bacterium]|nr:Hsp20/alpha crystallin family protein [Phycisphaerae bacterium]